MISTSVRWWTPFPSHWLIMCSYSHLCGSNQLVYMRDSHERWLHTWCESFQWSLGRPHWLQTINSINRADVNMGLSALMCHESHPSLSSLSRRANKSSTSAQKGTERSNSRKTSTQQMGEECNYFLHLEWWWRCSFAVYTCTSTRPKFGWMLQKELSWVGLRSQTLSSLWHVGFWTAFRQSYASEARNWTCFLLVACQVLATGIL